MPPPALLLQLLPVAAAFSSAPPHLGRPPFCPPTIVARDRPFQAPPPCTRLAALAQPRGGSVALGIFQGPPKPTPVERLQASLAAMGWLSWWGQAILSTVSGVLLLFANSVTTKPSAVTLIGRALAVGGLGCAIASALWVLGYSRLGRRLTSKSMSASEAAAAVSNSIRVGTVLNIAGMTLSILGAEAIVGTLAAKALTTSTTAAVGVVSSPVQALDVLIVQANTNTIACHFVGLLAGMRMRAASEACAAAA